MRWLAYLLSVFQHSLVLLGILLLALSLEVVARVLFDTFDGMGPDRPVEAWHQNELLLEESTAYLFLVLKLAILLMTVASIIADTASVLWKQWGGE